MFQSPTRAICADGSSAEPFAGGITQRGKPFQLVRVVRRVDGAAVGHIEAPHPHPVARRPERSRLRRGFDLGLVAPRRLALEADLHVVDADPRGDGHPVPLVESAVHHVVAGGEKRHGGELVVGALGLLHGQDVDVGALQPVVDTVDPRADRVDVPRGQPHGLEPTEAVVHKTSPSLWTCQWTVLVSNTCSKMCRTADLIEVMGEATRDESTVAVAGGCCLGGRVVCSARRRCWPSCEWRVRRRL